MVKLAQHIRDLNRERSSTRAQNDRRSRRTHHRVSPNPRLPLLVVVEHAKHQANDHQHQYNLDRDREDADNRPNRPVHEVGDDHLVHGSILEGMSDKR